MNILVIGGAGILGAMVVRELVENGCTPIVYSRSAESPVWGDARKKMEIVRGDILDYDGLLRAMSEKKVDRAIHCARSEVKGADSVPMLALRQSFTSMMNVLEAARVSGVRRVVYASSKAVFGTIRGKYGFPDYVPIDESYPCRPELAERGSANGQANFIAEQLGEYYRRRCGLEFTALRFGSSWAAGRAEKAHSSNRAITTMVHNAMTGKRTIVQHGDQKDDLTYFGNNAHAAVLACLVEKLKSSVYHIGYGRAMTLAEVAEEVRRLFPGADIEVSPGHEPDGFPWCCVMDIRRAQRELSYTPRFSLAQAILDMARLQPLFETY